MNQINGRGLWVEVARLHLLESLPSAGWPAARSRSVGEWGLGHLLPPATSIVRSPARGSSLALAPSVPLGSCPPPQLVRRASCVSSKIRMTVSRCHTQLIDPSDPDSSPRHRRVSRGGG